MEAAGVGVDASVDIERGGAAVLDQDALARLDLLVDEQHGVLHEAVAFEYFLETLEFFQV